MSALGGALFVAHGIGGIKDLPVPRVPLLLGRGDRARRSRSSRSACCGARPLLAATRGRPGCPRQALAGRPLDARSDRAQALSVVVFVVVVARRAASARPTTSTSTSRRPSSTSSSGSACRSCPCSSGTSGGCSRRGGRSRTRTSGCSSEGAGAHGRSSIYPERLGRWPGAVALLRLRRARARVHAIRRTRGSSRSRSRSTRTGRSFGMAVVRAGDVDEGGEGFAVAFGLPRARSRRSRSATGGSRPLAADRARRRGARGRVGRVRRRHARLGRASTGSAGRRRGRTCIARPRGGSYDSAGPGSPISRHARERRGLVAFAVPRRARLPRAPSRRRATARRVAARRSCPSSCSRSSRSRSRTSSPTTSRSSSCRASS